MRSRRRRRSKKKTMAKMIARPTTEIGTAIAIRFVFVVPFDCVPKPLVAVSVEDCVGVVVIMEVEVEVESIEDGVELDIELVVFDILVGVEDADKSLDVEGPAGAVVDMGQVPLFMEPSLSLFTNPFAPDPSFVGLLASAVSVVGGAGSPSISSDRSLTFALGLRIRASILVESAEPVESASLAEVSVESSSIPFSESEKSS